MQTHFGRQGSPSRKQGSSLAIYRALNELVRVYQFRDKDRVCCHDISITECYALEIVVGQGPLMLNDVAQSLYSDKGSASRVVSQLEEKGLVLRLVDPIDARALKIEATRKGRAIHSAIVKQILAEQQGLLSDIPAKVKSMLPEIFRRFAQAAVKREQKPSCEPILGPGVGRAKRSK